MVLIEEQMGQEIIEKIDKLARFGNITREEFIKAGLEYLAKNDVVFKRYPDKVHRSYGLPFVNRGNVKNLSFYAVALDVESARKLEVESWVLGKSPHELIANIIKQERG